MKPWRFGRGRRSASEKDLLLEPWQQMPPAWVQGLLLPPLLLLLLLLLLLAAVMVVRLLLGMVVMAMVVTGARVVVGIELRAEGGGRSTPLPLLSKRWYYPWHHEQWWHSR